MATRASSPVLKMASLLVFGGFIWAIPSSLPIARDILVLAHRNGYHPATCTITEVGLSTGNGGLAFAALVNIEGRSERVGLDEFAGWPDSWLGAFRYRGSFGRDEMLEYFQHGQELQVMYNPEAPNMSIGGQYPRVLKRHSSFGGYYWWALIRDAAICLVPLLTGCVLIGIFRPRRHPSEDCRNVTYRRELPDH